MGAIDNPSISCSLGQVNENGAICPTTIPEKEKSAICCNDKLSGSIVKHLSSTPRQNIRTEKDDIKKSCSPAVLEDRKHRIKVEIAKLLVKINEHKDDLEKCVQKQDFLMAQEIKTNITTFESDKVILEGILEREDGDELKDAIEKRYKKMGASQLFSNGTLSAKSNVVKTGECRPISYKDKDARNTVGT